MPEEERSFIGRPFGPQQSHASYTELHGGDEEDRQHLPPPRPESTLPYGGKSLTEILTIVSDAAQQWGSPQKRKQQYTIPDDHHLLRDLHHLMNLRYTAQAPQLAYIYIALRHT